MQTAIVYDGQCIVCRQSVAFIRRLDRHHAILPLDLHKRTILVERYPHLTLDAADLMHEIHVITRDGRLLSGYAGMQAIARELPFIRLGASLMSWPGIAWAGNRVYRWVAAHRYEINRLFGIEICEDGSCALPKSSH